MSNLMHEIMECCIFQDADKVGLMESKDEDVETRDEEDEEEEFLKPSYMTL